MAFDPNSGEVEEQTADRAFARAQAGYEWDGKVLEPFSALRDNAAREIGYRGGPMTSQDNIEAESFVSVAETDAKGRPKLKAGKPVMKQVMQRVKIYRQLQRDVQIVLWLCSEPKETALRILRGDTEWGIEKCSEWATVNGIRLTDRRFEKALEAYEKIAVDLNASFAVPDVKEGPATGN